MATSRPRGPRSSRARGHDLVDADRLRVQRQRAGLQPAHVEQVLDQPVEPVERLVGGGQQLVAGRSASNVDVVAAQAGHRGLGRGERGAQVVADRGEQRGAQPVGLGERPARWRPARPAAPGAARRRPGRRRPRAPAGRRPPAAWPRSTRVSSSSTGTSASPVAGRARTAARRRWRRPARPAVACCASGPRGARRARSSSVTARQAEGLPELVEQRRQRPLAAQHAAGERWTGSAPRRAARAASRVRRAARSTTALTATATSDEDHQGEQVLALGDGELVQRRGEEVVEQQEAADARRPGPGSSPPTSATATTASRKSRMSLGSAERRRAASQQQRSAAAGPAAASANPAAGAARDSAAGVARGRRRPRPTSSWVTRWTSIEPDSAVVVTPTPGAKQLGEPAAPAGARARAGWR